MASGGIVSASSAKTGAPIRAIRAASGLLMRARLRHMRSATKAALGGQMADLSAFPITARWPAKHPDLLQLYSLPTPNGVKVSIMLEEIGLPYEAHRIDFGKNDQRTPEFLSL